MYYGMRAERVKYQVGDLIKFQADEGGDYEDKIVIKQDGDYSVVSEFRGSIDGGDRIILEHNGVPQSWNEHQYVGDADRMSVILRLKKGDALGFRYIHRLFGVLCLEYGYVTLVPVSLPAFYKSETPDRVGVVAQGVKVHGERLAQLSENVRSGLANVAVHQARSQKRIEELEARIAALEAAEADVIEVEPISVAAQLTKAKLRARKSKRHRSQAEKLVDELIHPVLDADKHLRVPGGWSVIENLGEDVLAARPDLCPADLDFDFEEVLASALRWCDSRSRWFTRKRYWVQAVGNWTVVKHDRFWFRRDQVEADRKARSELKSEQTSGEE